MCAARAGGDGHVGVSGDGVDIDLSVGEGGDGVDGFGCVGCGGGGGSGGLEVTERNGLPGAGAWWHGGCLGGGCGEVGLAEMGSNPGLVVVGGGFAGGDAGLLLQCVGG